MFLTRTTNSWHIIKNCWRINYFLSFTRKYNFLGLFRFIRIKGHFTLVGQIWNFSRLSFNSLVDCVTSWTTEKRNVSLAKILVVDDNSQLRSLIYTKKNKGPKIDPWGTPAETSTQDEDRPFRTTLWYLLLKKFSISFNRVSDIPNDLILYISPSCQTLSKALEMSKKVPLTSKGGLHSNDL